MEWEVVGSFVFDLNLEQTAVLFIDKNRLGVVVVVGIEEAIVYSREVIAEIVEVYVEDACSSILMFFLKLFSLLTHHYLRPEGAILFAASSFPHTSSPKISQLYHLVIDSLNILKQCWS